MDINVKIEGLDKLAGASKRARDAIEAEILIGLTASGLHVVSEAKKSILQGQKSGRVYTRRTVSHRASAPGEAPASDTGRLVNSIASQLVRETKTAVITAGKGIAKYATFLEHGTRRMAARPFFFPAVEKSRAWIQARLNEAVNRGIKRSTNP